MIFISTCLVFLSVQFILLDKLELQKKVFVFSQKIRFKRLGELFYKMSQCRFCMTHNFIAVPFMVFFIVKYFINFGTLPHGLFYYTISLQLTGLIVLIEMIKR